MNAPATTPVEPKPWWRFGHVWLILSGPAAVVVAGFATLYIATNGQDPVVHADYYRRGIRINEQLARERALMPAAQARNHAVTPTAPAPGSPP